MTVNKIEVSYGRTISPKEYESKRADATIGVTLEEGDVNIDLELDDAMSYAMNVVHTTLGIGGANKTTPASKPVEETAPETEELTRGQKAARTKALNKAKKEAEEADKPPVEEVEQEDVTTRSPEPEPEDADDDFDINTPVSEEAPDPEPEETFDEISDADLGAEINKKAKLLKAEGDPEAVARVKAAIASFNTDGVDPFTAGMMSQSQRRKFLAKLDALKVRKAVKEPEAE